MPREFLLKDPLHPKGGITIKCKYDQDCVFCKHCSDIFWDYTNLIYMIVCVEDHDTCKRPCEYFEEAE
jgi:hypothetical protein